MRKTTPRRGLPLLWSTRGISLYVSWSVVGYITYFCTDYLDLNGAVVGILLLISKIIDTISNFVFAYIIDNTHSRLGKGRPWEVNILPMWVCIVLLFAIPYHWRDTAKYALVFLFYTLINAVYGTILACTDTIYFKHAITDEKERNSVQAVANTICMAAMYGSSIILPILIGIFEKRRNGWVMMTVLIAVPMAVLGMIRYLTIPEVDADITSADTEQVTIRDTIQAIVTNKYVWIITLMCFGINVMNNFNSLPATYYFTYIIGDIQKQSLVSIMSIAAFVFLPPCVFLANKIGRVKVLRICFLVSAAGCVMRFFAGSNMVLLMISSMIASCVVFPYGAFGGLMLIDSMDYGEWKNHKRVEGAIFAGYSLGSTLGAGVGAAFCGIFLNSFGYDGSAATQTARAILGIRISYGIIPALMCVLVYAALRFYDLEKKIPGIRRELEERRAAETPERKEPLPLTDAESVECTQ